MVELDECLVEIAPTPTFRWIETFDDGVLGQLKMSGGVFSGRLVAATDVPAGTADAQVYPPASGLQAFLAACCAWRNGPDEVLMRTRNGHQAPPCCELAACADKRTMACTELQLTR
jgi:hypothetical protein